MGDINNLKDSDSVNVIQSLADRPVLATTNALKAKFDEYNEEVRARLNNLIDYLKKSDNTDDGASNIGINSPYASTVKGLFDYIIGLGTGSLPPDGSITEDKLSTTIKTGLLANLTTSVKTSLVNAINEIVTNIGVLASLTTTAKTNIVAAINELVTLRSYDVGEVKYFAKNTAPTGYLKANGAAVSRSTYSALFSAIGTSFGNGDGSTTFNLPDLRGVFPRGWDDSRGLDAGRTFGSYQADAVLAHDHTATTSSSGAHTHDITASDSTYGIYTAAPGQPSQLQDSNTTTTTSAGAHTHTVTVNSAGGTENLVKNVALLACIKY